MIKGDPRNYAIKLISKFEKEFGMDVYVDWVTYEKYSWFGIETAGYWLENGESIIYIPKTRCKRTQEEFLYHELGHAIAAHYKIPKYITNLIGDLNTENYLLYRLKCIRYLYASRPEGMCSGYSQTNSEEEFAELIAFILCNRRKKRHYEFQGEIIDIKMDDVLSNKVKSIKRFLSILS